ncbi:MAG TPA: DNA polymerase III subunit gamma/tau [Clostridia bacterium]|nr:DNA polymerase III subunit gamma/tau [Clostridia bacterium]
MAYQALYRKYRPRRFGEVLGQEHVTTILKNQVTSGRVAHAYLFSGTRGTGKTSTAKILARAVNCLSPENGEPCGTCEACRLTEGETSDIVEMDAASNSGVDDIRALLDKARFLPLELKRKVYIIDEAHMLSGPADNALLKTLEEPPPHVVFILATTEPQSVTPTILSRCQRLDFHRLAVDDIVRCVDAAVRGVGARIDQEGLVAIARAAEGGMRDALSLADQCLAFCGQEVTAEGVYSVLGSMEGEFLFRIAAALLSGDRAASLRALDGVVAEGRDLFVFARDLTAHMRALLLAKLCGHCADVLECTEDAMRRYLAQAETASAETLLRAIDVLMGALANMRYLALPRVQLECAVVRIASPEEEPEQTASLLLERIEKLEAKLNNASFAPIAQAAPAPRAEPPMPKKRADDVPRAEKPTEFKGDASDDGAALWENLKKLVQPQNASLAALWHRTVSAQLSGNVLCVTFTQKTFADAFAKIDGTLTPLIEQLRPGTALRFTAAAAADSLEERARSAFGGNIEIVD